MKSRFVEKYKWIDDSEMLDITALAQTSPGPIGVNAAVLVGWKVCGAFGMIASVLGMIIPPMAILSVITFFYNYFADNLYFSLLLKGMQCGVAAVIFDVVFSLGITVLKNKRITDVILLILAFSVAVFTKINVIYILIFAAIFGIIIQLIRHRRKRNDIS